MSGILAFDVPLLRHNGTLEAWLTGSEVLYAENSIYEGVGGLFRLPAILSLPISTIHPTFQLQK